MRILRYRDSAGDVQVGVTKSRDEDAVYRLSEASADPQPAASHADWLSCDFWGGFGSFPCEETNQSVADVDLLVPVESPPNILCVGLNYQMHSDEFLGGKHDAPSDPIIFAKSSSCVVGPGDDVELHAPISDEVDYEAELAVVIGRSGRCISPESAWDHVLGLTALNDITARDLQRRHQQWTLGKSLDTFCPIGPWIVTLDEFELPLELEIRGLVDDEVRQSSNTSQLIFDIPTLISVVSRGRTLEVGDIIATGTPSGVGMAMDPPGFLRPGQSIAVDIEGIGILANTCVANV